mmetsp:Transcript_19967/g.17645  ORF Transcript_19967/g.17645 Transcript_19967/m.17645 type:complete len:217 (+) Transcript_19967:368-1018(+)
MIDDKISKIYKTCIGKIKSFKEGYTLILDLSREGHTEFIEKSLAGEYRFPDCNRIELSNIPVNSKTVKSFLRKSFPNKVGYFSISAESKLNNDIHYYVNIIQQVSRNIVEEAHVCNFKLDKINFISTLSSFKHLNKLGFIECKILDEGIPNFDDLLHGAKFSTLNFRGSGLQENSNWTTHPKRFLNLLYGLSLSEDVRNNLQQLYVHHCGVRENSI